MQTAQVEQHWRASRETASSDDEEPSVDQPVQKKAVRKLVLDKSKQAALAEKEIDPAAKEDEESEDEE